MPLTKRKDKMITFPLSVFETADTIEDLEDWLLSRNPEFIKRMRKARRDDIQGKGKDWKSLKKELCIKQLSCPMQKILSKGLIIQ